MSPEVAEAQNARPQTQELLKKSRISIVRLVDSMFLELNQTKKTQKFQDWLTTVSRFWRYSYSNQSLIRLHCPHATRVASRRLWAELGRTVLPDAEPIPILAPTYNGFSRFFIGVEVFDVSQTKGKPLPTISWEMEGPSPILKRIERAARHLGITVEDVSSENYMGLALNRHHIHVHSGLSPADRASTLVHEYAHALLHMEPEKGKRARKVFPKIDLEIQAEGVSYVVMKALGQPTTAATYLAAHFHELITRERIGRSLRNIVKASKEILRAFELTKRPRAAKTRQRTEGGNRRRSAPSKATRVPWWVS